MSVPADYKAVTSLQALPTVATHSMFGKDKLGKEPSPVDMFITGTDEINQLYLKYISGDMPEPLGSLVVLGYTSAVESYVRAIIRRTVLIDSISSTKAASLTLSFGAAYHIERTRLPEALLEHYSFSGIKGIAGALNDVLGIELKGTEISSAMEQFARICEIRHCCVHRSGRLGSRNAIRLGLDAHSSLLERPFRPSVDDLQDIADLLRTFVKTLNNMLFARVLERTVHRGGETVPEMPRPWKWTWSEDRHQFQRYYGIFSSEADSPPSPAAREAYASFAASLQPKGTFWLAAKDAKKKAGVKASSDPNAVPPFVNDAVSAGEEA